MIWLLGCFSPGGPVRSWGPLLSMWSSTLQDWYLCSTLFWWACIFAVSPRRGRVFRWLFPYVEVYISIDTFNLSTATGVCFETLDYCLDILGVQFHHVACPVCFLTGYEVASAPSEEVEHVATLSCEVLEHSLVDLDWLLGVVAHSYERIKCRSSFYGQVPHFSLFLDSFSLFSDFCDCTSSADFSCDPSSWVVPVGFVDDEVSSAYLA